MIVFYIVVYILIASFFLIEKYIRRGEDAKTLNKTEYDKGSTNLLGIAFVSSCFFLFVTPIMNHFKICAVKMNLVLQILGLLMMTFGISLRIIAVHTLGRYYMRTLRKTDNHQIVSKGIYKYIRHPGYSGNILLFLGAGVTMGNAISFIIITALMLIAYTYRIQVEEIMLVDIFGDKYRLYSKRTKRLIPFIY